MPPRKQLMVADLAPDATAVRPAVLPAPFRRLIALWIPRRFITPAGIELQAFLEDVNEKVVRRGFVLSDGQLLTVPIDNTIDPGPMTTQAHPDIAQEWLRIGKNMELIYERVSGTKAREVPCLREWGKDQATFFGPANPYQMAEDSAEYTWSHVTVAVQVPYVTKDERIAAILHGVADEYYFYCECHQAEVVYTTRHRLVCMGCGATHVVLKRPAPVVPKRLLTAAEWSDYFDDAGRQRDQEIEMAVLDFRDVENADTVWTTDQWEDAKHRFIFFSRSSPEEIEEAIRGTEQDPSIFLEAGWHPMETPLPPAHQVAADSIDVDLLENAAFALREGVRLFLKAKTDSGQLVNAIPHLFRATELILKAKLQQLDNSALTDQPSNPTVIKRLCGRGVSLDRHEVDNISRLRKLRNNLQHGTASFNYRSGLSICRTAILFLDRFVHAELALWLGAIIPPSHWPSLLAFPEIAATTDIFLAPLLANARCQPSAELSECAQCGKPTMLRPHPARGASCVRCGYVPIARHAE